MSRLVFEARIYRQGILRVVDVPQDFAEQLADWDFPPVIAELGGVERATTLVRRADGGLRLFLHAVTRRWRPSRVNSAVSPRWLAAVR